MPENSPPQFEYQVHDPASREISVLVVHPFKQRYWLHILLFLATFLSTLCIGARLQYDFNRNVWPLSDDPNFLPWTWAFQDYHRLLLGLPFAVSLLGILGAHEFGHYILCKRRGVLATLPFFIPFPSLFGTLGAVIRIRSPIRSRKDLFDIGIAGPIAGFVVAVPILLVSLFLSRPLAVPTGDSWPVLGYPLIFRLGHWALALVGSHAAGAQLGAHALYLAPVGMAAWVGMLATALNLIPGGQLDGGHIIFALSPRLHPWVSRLSIVALVCFAWFFSASWLLWAVVLRVTLTRHPIVPRRPALPVRSRILALSAALMLLVSFTPVPIPFPTLHDGFRWLQERIQTRSHGLQQR